MNAPSGGINVPGSIDGDAAANDGCRERWTVLTGSSSRIHEVITRDGLQCSVGQAPHLLAACEDKLVLSRNGQLPETSRLHLEGDRGSPLPKMTDDPCDGRNRSRLRINSPDNPITLGEEDVAGTVNVHAPDGGEPCNAGGCAVRAVSRCRRPQNSTHDSIGVHSADSGVASEVKISGPVQRHAVSLVKQVHATNSIHGLRAASDNRLDDSGSAIDLPDPAVTFVQQENVSFGIHLKAAEIGSLPRIDRCLFREITIA